MDLRIGTTTLGLPVADLAKGHGQLAMRNTLPGHLNGQSIASIIQDNLSASELEELNARLGTAHTIDETPKQEDFTELLMSALDKTNQAQNEVERLTAQAIVEPDSVDIHEVTIAMAKANMTLSLSKAIIDRSISGFKDILNQR
ncbi:flagellar hook-basal body complex protein FliE [Entomospira culicis]|uniref:Flagellar hook-basal body complex protein FliE n=1 Tax=Entomospira culicis TaxID=2719989 RepID=A0A968GGM5_9SPIO|nr:flagellar hook-basal body complex protein FliE [Entomospira culicis]NIZ19377.1 flagellar hook-basal body complex protein FliE [Entomospira culicis]NIZ69718.1 flagellar hook-basal body complex protein FliE [Entomospira culicis]WDI36829.1 flagellar hook-basal body complex protein FliE [Entomospira culicis]WDI38458.1 flagellar hook-basal body complex protein FliE [Entomospira culicis]